MLELIPAMVTPFEQGAINFAVVPRLVAYFEERGCDGVVIAGTNGEGPSLSATEKRDLSRLAGEVRDCKCFKIILCISTSSMNEAKWLVRQAKQVGVDEILLMAPHYFKEASIQGVELWFRELIEVSELPVLLYNFPQRTGFSLDLEMIHRLASLDRFAGLKDSSGEEANLGEYRKAVHSGHKLYVGDERLLSKAVSEEWNGTISGAANSVPTWLRAILGAEFDSVKFELLSPIISKIRSFPQPWGHKVILKERGIMPGSTMRIPLLEQEAELRAQIVSDIVESGFS